MASGSGPLQAAGIHAAVKAGDLEAVKRLIQADPSLLNHKDSGGNSPLHIAAQVGAFAVAGYLIEKGADLNAGNISGNAPVHEAIFNGKDEISRLLIEKGADLQKPNTLSRTPLHHAARYNRPDIAALLLARGVPVDSRDNFKRTPLILLCLMTSDVDVARILIDKGADVNAQDANGMMPLEHAVHGGSLALVDLLLDHGATYREDRNHALSVLFLAASAGSARLFKIVAEKGGGDLFKVESENAGVMISAISGGSLEIVNLLLAKGIPINPRPGITGWTPLHRAVGAKAVGLIELLVKNGVDVNARTNDGRSAYNIAEEQGDKESMALLLKWGGNAEPQIFPVLTGPYLGQTPPGPEFRRFAPGIVTGGHSTVTVTPDGREMYWAENSRIVGSKLEDGRWTKPAVVPFSGSGSLFSYDDNPFVTPDNRRMFFTSLRPLGLESGNKENIWSVERTPGGWSDPRPAGPEINAMQLHWQFSVSKSGTLYFSGTREGEGRGVFYSPLVNGNYGRPVKMGPTINGDGGGSCPYIAPDESYLLFANLQNGGIAGLYISFKSKDGQWLPAVKFSSGAGSPTAIVTPDGKYLFSGLSWMEAKFIEEMRPKEK